MPRFSREALTVWPSGMPGGNGTRTGNSPLSWPVPPQCKHSKKPTPSRPPHVRHRRAAGTSTRTWSPVLASSRSIGTSTVSPSRRSPLGRERPVKLPYSRSKMSSNDGWNIWNDRPSETGKPCGKGPCSNGSTGGRQERRPGLSPVRTRMRPPRERSYWHLWSGSRRTS